MLRQHRHPLTKTRILEIDRIRTPTSEANPAEVAGGGDLCLDEGLDGAAEHEVGAGDDTGAVLAALLAAVRRVDAALRKPPTSSGKLRVTGRARPVVGWGTWQGMLWRTALMAATPWTNSASPSGRITSGPSLRYIALHCTKTVAITLWPQVSVSPANSSSR